MYMRGYRYLYSIGVKVNPDVIVIGGGPAGSTTSTLIAQRGYRVQLFERDRFPRFHIGESLIPETYWVLQRLNMLPKMQASHFVKKYSVQFVNSQGKESAPFYFWDNKPHECSQTWQVVRSEFDKMMLDNAREHGVDAQEGVRVLEVLFDGDRAVGVKIRDQQNNDREVFAKVVVDASGQTAMLQNRFKLRLWDPVLNKGAIWTYWEGAYRDTGRDEGATLVMQTADKQGWFWYIPQHDNIVSVGVVAPFDYLFNRTREPREDLRGGSRESAGREAAARVGRERVTGYFVTKDYSYRVETGGRRRLGAGGRRLRLSRSAVLVGRAAGAQVGSARCRRDLRGARKGGHLAGQLGAWGDDFNLGVDRMRRLVCEYYAGFSFGEFVRKYPELRGTVTDLLIGDLFNDRVDKVWAPMESLYKPGKDRIPGLERGHARGAGARQGK